MSIASCVPLFPNLLKLCGFCTPLLGTKSSDDLHRPQNPRFGGGFSFLPPVVFARHCAYNAPNAGSGAAMTNYLYQNDLPDGLDLGPSVAIDSETMGLDPRRDRLCLVQLSAGDGHAHLVQIHKGQKRAPNLERLLADPNVLKIFHFARFDVAALFNAFGVVTAPIYCTKIASKMVRTFTDRHGLKNLVQEFAGLDISKQQQSSDWGAQDLSAAQLDYAASDVLYLHQIMAGLNIRLAREGRRELAQACFDFLPARAQLDLLGWEEPNDIFHH